MSRLVLVTGASGFVGRDLVVRLAREGIAVRAAARRSSAIPEHSRIERAALPDLERTFDWRPLLAGVTDVVHLAGIAHAASGISAGTYDRVNAEATRSLAAAARIAGVRRVVLLSSVRAQSGPVSAEVVTEAQRPAPTDFYGRSKALAERFLSEALDGSQTSGVALRPVLVYGPGVKGNLRALVRLAQWRLPLPFGGLANRRSILGQANLGAAVRHALEADAMRGRAFLVADPEPVTVAEIVTMLRRAAGRRPGIVALPPRIARLLAALAGKREAWDRLSGRLMVSTAALEASGWRPVESTANGLARWMQQEADGSAWLRRRRGISRA